MLTAVGSAGQPSVLKKSLDSLCSKQDLNSTQSVVACLQLIQSDSSLLAERPVCALCVSVDTGDGHL